MRPLPTALQNALGGSRQSGATPRAEEEALHPMADPMPIPQVAARLTARALLLGERIDTAGLERSDLISTTPLAFRVGSSGYAVLFRYGVVVLIGLSPIEEDEVVRGIGHRVT